MNLLVLGNSYSLETFKYLIPIKESLNLENFNISFCYGENKENYTYINDNKTEEKELKNILKDKRWKLILIYQSTNNLEEMVNYIKKFTKGEFIILQDRVPYDIDYKMIPLYQLKENASKLKEDEINYLSSLLILKSLYHIELEKAYNPYSNEIISICETTYNNPYNSKLYGKKIAFIGNEFFKGKKDVSFIEMMYAKSHFAYLKDCSNKPLIEKLDTIPNIYDAFVIEALNNIDDIKESLEYIKNNYDTKIILVTKNNAIEGYECIILQDCDITKVNKYIKKIEHCIIYILSL